MPPGEGVKMLNACSASHCRVWRDYKDIKITCIGRWASDCITLGLIHASASRDLERYSRQTDIWTSLASVSQLLSLSTVEPTTVEPTTVEPTTVEPTAVAANQLTCKTEFVKENTFIWKTKFRQIFIDHRLLFMCLQCVCVYVCTQFLSQIYCLFFFQIFSTGIS